MRTGGCATAAFSISDLAVDNAPVGVRFHRSSSSSDNTASSSAPFCAGVVGVGPASSGCPQAMHSSQ